MISRRRLLQTTAVSAAALAARGMPAWGANAPGVTATEIKIGQTMPYSGNASAYGTIGKAELAYFKMINEQGGINGRKINLISLDDGYSPPKTVELVRRLVEQDEVAFLFQTLGTPSNSAIHQYCNDEQVPQLFVATGATKWNDPKGHPWTMGWQPNYQTEAKIYAKYILANKPDAKISILYQNDDFGKDYLIGLKAGLGDKFDRMVVKEASYESTDPTVDSQIVTLQGSGADTHLTAAIPKYAAQAIRKAYDIGWKPTHFLTNVSISVGSVLQPAGLEKSQGIISADYRKDASDPRWNDDPGKKQWLAFMQKYMPDADLKDNNYPYGMMVAMTMVQVLKQCANDLSRENIMKQAASLKNLEMPMLLPGITINTSATDFAPIKQMQLQRFDGKSWELFGDVLAG
ncbi:MAG TPA: ABC transporter substrate-binding protein [Stellaceae bacterium]|nr:ABC transporter substrate-binding protein [Stellaceae bacterium]